MWPSLFCGSLSCHGRSRSLSDPLYSPGLDYIAMANTQICGLIGADLNGGALDQLVPQFQGIFLSLFHDNLRTYQDQYPLFGNPKGDVFEICMGLHRLLGISGSALFPWKNNRRRLLRRDLPGIGTIRDLNRRMQDYFRELDAADPSPRAVRPISTRIRFRFSMAVKPGIEERLDDAALQERFARNVRISTT